MNLPETPVETWFQNLLGMVILISIFQLYEPNFVNTFLIENLPKLAAVNITIKEPLMGGVRQK